MRECHPSGAASGSRIRPYCTDGSITLNVVGKFVGIPGGHPQDVSFSVTILSFGGAGVGQWTLSIGDDTFCFETLRSGQIVMRRSS